MNIYTIGYFQSNLGDDLMLLSLIGNNKKHTFYLNGCSKLSFKNFENEKNVKRSENGKMKSLLNCEAIAFIGGSLFQDYDKAAWFYYLKLSMFILAARLLRKKVYILSSNFGPFSNLITKYSVKLIVYFSSKVVVRDRESYLFASKIKSKGVYLEKDIVEYYQDARGEKSKRSPKEIKKLGVSVIYNRGWKQEKYINELVKYIKRYIDRGCQSITLYSFHDTDDYEQCEIIKSKITPYLADVNIIGSEDIHRLIDNFSKEDYVICSRFHSMILAIIQNKNFSLFCYSNKISNYLKSHSEITHVEKSELPFTKLHVKRVHEKSNGYVL